MVQRQKAHLAGTDLHSAPIWGSRQVKSILPIFYLNSEPDLKKGLPYSFEIRERPGGQIQFPTE